MREVSEALVIVCFLNWVLAEWTCRTCENSVTYVLMFSIYSCIYFNKMSKIILLGNNIIYK